MNRRTRPALYVSAVILAVALSIAIPVAPVSIAQDDDLGRSLSTTQDVPAVAPDAPVSGGPSFYTDNGLAFSAYPDQSVLFVLWCAALQSPYERSLLLGRPRPALWHHDHQVRRLVL